MTNRRVFLMGGSGLALAQSPSKPISVALIGSGGVLAGEAAAAAVFAARPSDGFNNTLTYSCSSDSPAAGASEPDNCWPDQPIGVNVGPNQPFTCTTRAAPPGRSRSVGFRRIYAGLHRDAATAARRTVIPNSRANRHRLLLGRARIRTRQPKSDQPRKPSQS